jgi:sugar phosphate isomerase/epimerase
MKRRDFIRQSAGGAAALAIAGPAAVWGRAVNWPIGCFNRPWTRWPFDEALKQIKAAGYPTTGLLSRTRDEAFIGAAATPEYVDRLKGRIAASGLKANMGALRSQHAIPFEDSVRDVRTQIDNAQALSLEYVLSFGADNPEELGHYCKVMHDAAAYGEKRKVKLVMKPHGGISGSSTEILQVIKAVNHRNFSIWYDAGNIIYYTGKDPISEIAPIASHITGFCAKDCGSPKGDVMIQFGTGKVDFPGVFKSLKAAGFNGPVMVEGCKVGETPEDTAINARANREFLERTLGSI